MEATKQKSFRISEDLAMEFEIRAKKNKTTEIELITRYIKEGLERDENKVDPKQLTFD